MWKRARHARRSQTTLRHPAAAENARLSASPSVPDTAPLARQGAGRGRRIVTRFIMVAVLASTLSMTTPTPKPAQACGDYCLCETVFHAILRSILAMQSAATALYITTQFIMHREIFWEDWMWRYNIGNALMMWTQEISTAAMTETFAIGTFFDAKHQLETQRVLQTRMVDAWRDYKPDIEMCTIGTAARGLAQTSRTGELAAHALAQQQLDRLTNTRNSSGLAGPASDNEARLRLLKSRFCDARDASGLMGASVCNPASAVEGRNHDVDFNQTVMAPLTIDVNLTDGATANGPEQDLFGLSANLYGHRPFRPFSNTEMADERGQSYLLDQRAIAAKRSVALHSFGSIVGMKAAGAGTSTQISDYLRAVYQQLGVDTAEVPGLVGRIPSYYAQMDILSKGIFQKPEFYTNLYDAPANVERKGAAIRAIRLIQDMDKFNSVLRSEQSLSVLLELYIEDLQKDKINMQGSDRR